MPCAGCTRTTTVYRRRAPVASTLRGVTARRCGPTGSPACSRNSVWRNPRRCPVLVALDAIGIREGGGAAVLAELLHWLPRVRPDWHWHVFLFDRHLRQFDDPPVGPNVVLESTRHGHSGAGRLLWVNWLLPRRLRRLRANLLFSFANLGSSRPPVAQVVYC